MEETLKIASATKSENFFVAVSRGILPSNVLLTLKGVNITTRCNVCGIDEDDLHVLFYCPVAVEYWRILGSYFRLKYA